MSLEHYSERIAKALEAIADATTDEGLLFKLRHDQQWLIDRVINLTGTINDQTAVLLRLLAAEEGSQSGHNSIHVTALELKETSMPPVDHAPDLQLPSSSVRALLQIVNPIAADGTPFTGSITWTSSDDTQLPLEAVADSTDANGARVAQVYANTPLDAGTGVVTASADGFASCDIKVTYSDPPVGHFAITGGVVAEA